MFTQNEIYNQNHNCENFKLKIRNATQNKKMTKLINNNRTDN